MPTRSHAHIWLCLLWAPGSKSKTKLYKNVTKTSHKKKIGGGGLLWKSGSKVDARSERRCIHMNMYMDIRGQVGVAHGKISGGKGLHGLHSGIDVHIEIYILMYILKYMYILEYTY